MANQLISAENQTLLTNTLDKLAKNELLNLAGQIENCINVEEYDLYHRLIRESDNFTRREDLAAEYNRNVPRIIKGYVKELKLA
jgi:hypothetical protein